MMRRFPRSLAAAAVVVWLVGAAVPAHAVAPTFSLQQSFTEAGVSEFGTSVSCLDEWAVAGGKGKAIVYRKVDNTWSRFAELLPEPALADPAADGFGLCVDMDDGIVVVGAPNTNGGVGAAYVFTYSSTQAQWFWSATLQPDTPVPNGQFGTSVSVDGNVIVVGAPAQDGQEDQFAKAAVYIFTQNTTWTQLRKIDGPAEPPATVDWFGHEVCVHGSDATNKWLIVGAPKTDGFAGQAHVYKLTNGVPQDTGQVLRIFGTPTAGEHFGCAVAVRGSTLIVGAPGTNALVPSQPTGGAFVFVYNSTDQEWQAQGEITEPTPSPDFFGYSVALCTDVALVGAPASSDPPPGPGTASFYRRAGSTWSPASDVELGNGATTGDRYGYCVDTYCTVAMVGAPYDNGKAGTVYFHTTSKALPVYRFYNPRAGTHFYTDSKAERDYVWQSLSRYYTWEGTVYSTNPENNTHPLHRFYNISNGSHFYTPNDSEKADVETRLGAIFKYDGPTYLVSITPGVEGKLPVHRFFCLRNGSHFYTASDSEKNDVINRLGAYYKYEGVGFYLGQ